MTWLGQKDLLACCVTKDDEPHKEASLPKHLSSLPGEMCNVNLLRSGEVLLFPLAYPNILDPLLVKSST